MKGIHAPPQRPRRTRQQISAKMQDLMLTSPGATVWAFWLRRYSLKWLLYIYKSIGGTLMPASSLCSGKQAPHCSAVPAMGSGQRERGARDPFMQLSSHNRATILSPMVSRGVLRSQPTPSLSHPCSKSAAKPPPAHF